MATVAHPRRPAGPPRADSAATDRRSRLTGHQKARRLNRSYSRIVGILKIVLPVVAVALMATAVLWPSLNPDHLETVQIAGEDLIQAGGSGEITSPRYFGTDEQGRPYEVTAASAKRIEGEGERYEIVHPTARLILSDGEQVDADAGYGILDREAGLLLLSEGVVLRRSDGTEFRSEAAIVDLDGETMTGDRPVTGTGPFGTLTAEGFRVAEEGRIVTFTGRTRLDMNAQEETAP